MKKIITLYVSIVAGFGLFAQQTPDTVPAHYPGGPGAWARYLYKNFRVPAGVEPDGHSVLLVFHVSVKGQIGAVRMIRGDTLLRNTLTDLLINSSPWVPATVAGKPIPSTQYLPINYHLQTE